MAPQAELTATYTAPNESKRLTYALPNTSANLSTEDRTAYLTTLRSSVSKLQAEVNTFLTQKMAEEAQSTTADSKPVDEAKEEANYGEEVID